MRSTTLIFAAVVLGCSAAAEDPIAEAKQVIKSHEEFTGAGNLEGIVSNAADDIVVLTAGAPIVEGIAAFEQFYSGLLRMGQWDFSHVYEGEQAVGNLVLLHGVSEGTVTPPNMEPSPFINNFMLVLRRDEDGTMKVWRAAFAPSSE